MNTGSEKMYLPLEIKVPNFSRWAKCPWDMPDLADIERGGVSNALEPWEIGDRAAVFEAVERHNREAMADGRDAWWVAVEMGPVEGDIGTAAKVTAAGLEVTLSTTYAARIVQPHGVQARCPA